MNPAFLKIKKSLFLLIALGFWCSTAAFSNKQQFSVFLFTKTAGWHHESINAGVTAIQQLAEIHHFNLEWHEDAGRINDENLERFDVIVFLNTTGDILNEKQQAAMERFIQSGKGFVGIHAAADTEYDWEWYTKLVGRMFHIHPTIQTGQLSVLDASFPGLERMPEKMWWTEEWYEFGAEQISGLQYLLSVDEKTFDPKVDWGEKKGQGMGEFHPLAWYHEYDGGRSFYTALGHQPSKYSDPIFLAHLYGGIYWAAQGQRKSTAASPEQIPLWPTGAPGFEHRKEEPEEAEDWWVKNIHQPSITAFLPPKDKANGTAVIIAPGGGHRALVYNSEGKRAAEFFNRHGIAAFVLKYRLAREEGSPYSLEKHVQQDAYRAMRLVRSRAAEWNLTEGKIGMMGFSAGGEVVAQVAYSSGDGQARAKDPIDRLNGKPDFQILVYPGPLFLPEKVPSDAPPAFMIAAIDDECCAAPVIELLQKFHAAKVPAEAHVFAQGQHAFNMGYRSESIAVKNWSGRLLDWLKDAGLL